MRPLLRAQHPRTQIRSPPRLRLLNAGLEMDDLHELIKVAMVAKTRDAWRYFCGCCWRRIKQSQEHARSIIELWESEGR